MTTFDTSSKTKEFNTLKAKCVCSKCRLSDKLAKIQTGKRRIQANAKRLFDKDDIYDAETSPENSGYFSC